MLIKKVTDSFIMPLEKPKPKSSVSFGPNKFSTYYSFFSIESNKGGQATGLY